MRIGQDRHDVTPRQPAQLCFECVFPNMTDRPLQSSTWPLTITPAITRTRHLQNRVVLEKNVARIGADETGRRNPT